MESAQSRNWPLDVGIIALEVYFPSHYVDQAQLETYNSVSQGKYTAGLGQSRMGFCSDREDINSLCLTALTNLVERTGIEYQSIGRLEVGTETIVDKSKSVKTVLMSVLGEHGNCDVEGVDTTNACYGGTAALLNAVNWIESSAWDGRYAVVVAGDIAVYADGPARPTGGAGAVAMLLGPHAPLVLDTGVRSSYMQHSYDFYKPDMSSEYATVDGKLSIQCYFSAVDACYKGYLSKASKRQVTPVEDVSGFDALLFHTPYCKLVQKSVSRILFNDFLNCSHEKQIEKYPGLEEHSTKLLADTYFDRDVEKAFMSASKEVFATKTEPSLRLASQVGNMYTASLYGGLASLLACYASDPESLLGHRIAMFSYGSGFASTLFSITVKLGYTPSARGHPSSGSLTNGFISKVPVTNGVGGAECVALTAMVESLKDLEQRLESRVRVSPEQFSEVMSLRERTHHLAPYIPSSPIDELFPGTWYIDNIDAQHRRHYGRRPADGVVATCLCKSTVLEESMKEGEKAPVIDTNGTLVDPSNGCACI